MATKKKTSKTDGTKDNDSKVINRISFTRDQLLQFLDMTKEEAGEFIIDIARFVSDGTYPVMKDRYKARYFKSIFGDALARQLKVNEIRVNQCLKNAENRNNAGSDNSDNEDVSHDADNTEEVATTDMDNVTTTVNEDLSYKHFKTLYEKADSGKYDAKILWDRQSDDDKRKILAYVESNIVGKVDVSKRDFPSAFINGGKWKVTP